MFNISSILAHADPIGITVMAILLLFSIISWTIILAKWQMLMRLNRLNQAFINTFWHTKDLNELLSDDKKNSGPSSKIFKDGVHEYERQKQRSKEKEDAFLVIERSLVRTGRSELKKAESQVAMLATIGAISPFIGLFGTVVGIMSSFREIGLQGNASLSTVAPGIAEALFATALGLFASIPAVMAYNSFQLRLKNLRADVDNFCLDLLAVLKSQK